MVGGIFIAGSWFCRQSPCPKRHSHFCCICLHFVPCITNYTQSSFLSITVTPNLLLCFVPPKHSAKPLSLPWWLSRSSLEFWCGWQGHALCWRVRQGWVWLGLCCTNTVPCSSLTIQGLKNSFSSLWCSKFLDSLIHLILLANWSIPSGSYLLFCYGQIFVT